MNRKGLLAKLFGSSDEPLLPPTGGDFGGKLAVFGFDAAFAEQFLDGGVVSAITRLAEIGEPIVHVNRAFVAVEVKSDLSKTRREDSLVRFLDDAEAIVTAASGIPATRAGGSSDSWR